MLGLIYVKMAEWLFPLTALALIGPALAFVLQRIPARAAQVAARGEHNQKM